MKPSLIFFMALLCGSMALAEASVFSPDQLAKLQSTRLKIAVPAYVPAGFRVSNVYVAWEDTSDVSYAILYEGPQQGCFIVEAAGGGIGDMMVQNAKGDFIRPTMRIKNAALGTASVWHAREYLGTDWFDHPTTRKTGPFFAVKGDVDRSLIRDLDPATAQRCRRIPVGEFVKVVRSLQPFEKVGR